MTVHFIGAGPGAADLLTLRGRDIIAYKQFNVPIETAWQHLNE